MRTTDIYSYLFEQEEQNQKQAPEKNLATKPVSDKVKASDDSVDDQIDALILKYENSSISERPDPGPMSLSESLSKKKLGYLFEQEEEDAEPEDMIRFSTRFSIRANTESVTINGQLQPVGLLSPGAYTISGANTVVFNESVEKEDFVVITYIKG